MTDKGPADDTALSAASARVLPAVATRGASPGLWLGIMAIGLLGAGTFYALNSSRTLTAAVTALPATGSPPTSSASLPPPPVLAPVAAPVIAPQPVAAPVAAAVPITPPPPPSPPRSAATPAMIVDFSAGGDAETTARAAATPEKLGANEAFAARISGAAAETAVATRLTSTQMVVPQGSIIVAVLETAINSDLPGQVRAVVSRDVLGFDGSRILIPRGSRLIGQYSSGVALGQSRAFVIWTRLLRPDGVSVQLGSPGTDELGSAGLAGKVNSHFLRRFGAATLLSVITAGLDYLTNSALNGGGSVIVGTSSQATQLAGIALQRQIDIPPTIRVAQGTPVRVLVARDLDFTMPAVRR